MKLNIADLANKIKKQFKDDVEKAASISTGSDMTTPTQPEDFIVLDNWWKEATGLLGLPYGYVFMIAGNTDSGKTSFTIEAMRAAQKQNVAIILVDTEKKTTKSRLAAWGVDPDQVARVQPEYLEDAYDGIDKWWNAIKDADPDARILIIFDSLGNTPARAETETDVDDSLQMGLAAKVNKRGFRRMVPKLAKDKVHILVINQTYANMGSPGRTNAGGNAVDYFSALTFQTSRFKWLEKKVKGEDVRVGARVAWTLYKSHIIEPESMLRKKLLIDITSDGMKLTGSTKEESNDES
jgi:recombination protein RecA